MDRPPPRGQEPVPGGLIGSAGVSPSSSSWKEYRPVGPAPISFDDAFWISVLAAPILAIVVVVMLVIRRIIMD